MDFQVGEEQPLPGIGEHVTVLTQVNLLQIDTQSVRKWEPNFMQK